MKKAYELSTLTGTQVSLVLQGVNVDTNGILQVMLLVASETGHVYTFATRWDKSFIIKYTFKLVRSGNI